MSAQAKLAPKPICLCHLAISLILVLLACTVVASEQPLVSPLAKDKNTSLYTISIKNGAPLVVDLTGSLVWSTCPCEHETIPCYSDECKVVDQLHHRYNCPYTDGDRGGNGDHCTCTAYPYNPVTGQCGAGELTRMAMSANATDGRNTLNPVAFSTVSACAPDRLLKSLPAAATGVAGFSRWPLSLPSQISAQRESGDKFALCLPHVAFFGNTSVYLGTHPVDLTTAVAYTPLLKNPKNAGYYLPVKSISVSWDQVIPVSLPSGALDLDDRTGHGGVVISTVMPYMTMRPDVYHSFIQAYDTAMRGRSYVERVAAVKPFELCYNTGTLRPLKLFGYDVPWIRLELQGGATGNWTVPNANYLVFVGGSVVCVGVVETGQAGVAPDDEPAVVIGGMQLEEHLLVFDVDKGVLGFSDLLWYRETSCGSFNFTMTS